MPFSTQARYTFSDILLTVFKIIQAHGTRHASDWVEYSSITLGPIAIHAGTGTTHKTSHWLFIDLKVRHRTIGIQFDTFGGLALDNGYHFS